MLPGARTRRQPVDLSGLDLEPAPGAPPAGNPLFEGLDLEPERSFSPVATGLRVLPGIAGTYIGGALGAGTGLFAGGAGAVPGAALGASGGGFVGSALGEFLAELYEGRSINPSDENGVNPTQIGLQGAIGAIPGIGPIRNLRGFAGLLARTGTNAVTGATIGGLTAPVVSEVEREGLEGLNVFDLEPGAVDKMVQGAKWGGAFGAGGSLAMEGIGKYLASRAARRAAAVDTGYDPNFDSRYKPAPSTQQRVARPQPTNIAPSPEPETTAMPMGPQPIPGEVPSPIPPPFSAPSQVPPPMAATPEPIMPRPKRAYADDAELLSMLEPEQPTAAAAPARPTLPPDVQRELVDLGINPELVNTLTMQDADEIFAKMRAPQYDEPTQKLYDQVLETRRLSEPNLDEQQFREEFEFALERFYEDQSNTALSGRDPIELAKEIARRGGINEIDDGRGLAGELDWLKESSKAQGYGNSGGFGSVSGVPGVLRRTGGVPFDVMAQDLANDPRFSWIEGPDDIIQALDDAMRNPNAAAPRRATPTMSDLRLPESMGALGRRPVDLESMLSEVPAIAPESDPMEALRRAGFIVDEPVPAAAKLPAAEMIETPGYTGPDRRAAAGSFTPDVQRDLMMDLAGDPNAVAGGRKMMRRLSDINANRIPEPPRGVEDLVETAPRARFAGMQDDGLGGEFPIYTIEGGPNDRSTVSARKLQELGIEVPSASREEQIASSLRELGYSERAIGDVVRKTPTDVVLPGTEGVRSIENATPEVAEAPFALEPPKRGQAIEQQARGDREASAQGELEDFFANPERGAMRPQLAGALGGAAIGAAGGTASIDEDDTTLEKIAKVAGGATLGAGAGGAVAGRLGSSPTAIRPGGSRPPASTPAAGAAAVETITPARGEPVRLPKYAGNINLERIDTTDSVKATINQVATELRPQMENARRGRIAQDVTRQMAAELGMTEAELLARRRGQAFNAEQALAAREINAASARRLTEAAAAARSSPTPENYSRLMLSLQQQVAIQEQIAGATAEAGRSLAQFRMMAQDTLTLPELNELIMSSGGTENLDAIATRLMQIDPTNIRAVNQFARDVRKASVVDKVYEAWMNALLSGPVTHVANTVSNGLTALTHPVEKGMAGVLDLLRAKAGGGPQERFAREGAYALVGLWKGLAGGVRAGLQAAITDVPQFGTGRQEATTPGGKIGGTVGHVVRTPTKALLFEDEFFKNIVYSADIHARAVRQALREGSKGRAIGERVAEILQNPTVELKQAGQKEALYRTFNTPLTARWERSIMELRNAVPGARWIIPFLRTPINVAKFGLERTPLHLGDLMAKIASGKLSIQDLEEEAAKVAIGASLAMGVASAYQNGLITGGGSPDRSKHATQAVNRPDYSVKVGDQWYSYQRLEPLGISLGLTADFMETLETGKQDVTQLPAKLLYSFSRNLQSKTFLQGMTDFFNVLSDYPRYGDEWINRMAGSVVPTAVAQVARASDPIVRKPRSAAEAIMNRTGQGESLTPMLDVFGRPITSDMSTFERLVSPVQRRKANQDPLIDELERLGVTLSVPSERLTVKGHELSTNDKSTLAQARGQRVKRELDDLFQSQSFQRADDDDRRERVERAINQARDAVSRRARMLIRRNEPLSIEDLLGINPAQ